MAVLIRMVEYDQETILKRTYDTEIDTATTSVPHPVDNMILSMHNHKLIKCIADCFPDKRTKNSHIPLEMIRINSIAAKMKNHNPKPCSI